MLLPPLEGVTLLAGATRALTARLASLPLRLLPEFASSIAIDVSVGERSHGHLHASLSCPYLCLHSCDEAACTTHVGKTVGNVIELCYTHLELPSGCAIH